MTAVDVDGRTVTVSNLEKVLWPECGYTKGDMIAYYVAIAPVLLPHLADRALTLRRFPDGIHGVSWHQNECKGEPGWLRVYERRGRQGRMLRFCVVEDLPALVWVANQAAIELHPFLWRTQDPDRPTQIVFDLDPGPPAGLLESAEVALRVRSLLAELGMESYAKTSGSLGMHVHAPLAEPLDTKRVARRSESCSRSRSPISSSRTRDVRLGWEGSTSTGCRTTRRGRRSRRTPSAASPERSSRRRSNGGRSSGRSRAAAPIC